jgi:hypothetical protein
LPDPETPSGLAAALQFNTTVGRHNAIRLLINEIAYLVVFDANGGTIADEKARGAVSGGGGHAG